MTLRTNEQQIDGATMHETARAAGGVPDHERWFRSFAESLPQLVWMCRPDGEWNYLSPRWADFTGCPEAEQFGQGWLKQIHPNDRLSTAAAWHAAISTGAAYEGEFRILRHDQSYRWFSARAVPQRDEQGQIACWLGSAVDIEEQRQARKILDDSEHAIEKLVSDRTAMLRESLTELWAVIEAQPACVKILDANGCLLAMNAAGLVLVEADDPAQVRGVSVLELLLPAHHAAYLEGIKAALAGETVLQVYEIQGLRGTRRWMEQRSVAMKGASATGAPRVIAITHDITSRLREQERLTQSEASLRASEERQRSVVTALSEGVVLYGPEGEIRSANPAALRILGLSEDQFLRQPVASLWRAVYEDGRPYPDEAQPAMLALRTGQAVLGVTMGIDRAHGGRTWLSVSAQPLFGEQSENPYGAVVSFVDITERRRIHQELRRAREGVDNASEGIVWITRGARIVEANPAACGLLGCTRDEALQLSLLDIDSAHSEDLWPEYWDRLQRQGAATYETQLVHKGGKLFPVEIACNLVIFDQEEFVCAFVRDIAPRKKIEEERRRAVDELSAHAEMMRAAASVSGLGAWEVDPHTRAVRVGEEVAAMLGLPPGTIHLSLDTALAVHSEEVRNSLLCMLEAAVVSATPFDHEMPFFHPEHGDRIIRTVGRPLVRSGRVERLVGFAQDITTRKLKERQRQELEESLRQAAKLSAVGTLAGGVAHDFNNMLGVILASADEALRMLSPEAPVRAEIEEIRRAAHHSASLTDRLLAFARKQPIAPRAIDLTVSVASMLTMLRRLIGEDITLDWLPDALPCWVMIDPGQLDQLLANLLVNARDAIGGVGRIAIATRSEAEPTDTRPGGEQMPAERRVVLSVSDDGCGMDEGTIDRIFEPFFTTKDQGKGTGLGLAMVHGIVGQNQGTIRVESAPGLGATFLVTLPYQVPTTSALISRTVDPLPLPGGNETILLVEDEPALLRLNRRMLERLGYKVLAAAGAEEALEVGRTHTEHIDVLLTDVVMPRMTGLDLQQRLQTMRPDLKCLFVSGYPMEVLTERGVLEEDIHFLPKPFSSAECAAMLLQVLGRA